MENFTPIASLLGGMLIGLSASIMLLFNGKIAGISGIVGGLLSPATNDTSWRLVFLAGRHRDSTLRGESSGPTRLPCWR